jgi:hypothetical protein
LVGEVFEVRTQVDYDLTPVNRFDRPLWLIKNLGVPKMLYAIRFMRRELGEISSI